VQCPQLGKHFVIGESAAAFTNDALGCIEITRLNNGFEHPVGAHPHIRRVHHTTFFQLEGFTVKDVVADVFFVGEDAVDNTARPFAAKIG
jgi:hypothetical protein